MEGVISVITGDVVSSRSMQKNAGEVIHSAIQNLGISESDYQIYRGDGFQVRTAAHLGFISMLQLRTAFIQMDSDVRMGLGVGSGDTDKPIEMSEGEAFVASGEAFDLIRKNGWHMRTRLPSFERSFNIMLSLADLLISSYKPATARWLSVQLNAPDQTQSELAGIHQTAQSTISEALKRAGYHNLMEVDDYFRDQILNV
jgi:hypothetical protein